MSHPFINDPKYWRERAMEARSIAKLLNDAEAKRLLLEIGTSYERLADHLKEVTSADMPTPNSNS